MDQKIGKVTSNYSHTSVSSGSDSSLGQILSHASICTCQHDGEAMFQVKGSTQRFTLKELGLGGDFHKVDLVSFSFAEQMLPICHLPNWERRGGKVHSLSLSSEMGNAALGLSPNCLWVVCFSSPVTWSSFFPPFPLFLAPFSQSSLSSLTFWWLVISDMIDAITSVSPRPVFMRCFRTLMSCLASAFSWVLVSDNCGPDRGWSA